MPKIVRKSEKQKTAEAAVDRFRKDLGPFVVAADALAALGVPFAYATSYGQHGVRDTDTGRPVLMKPFRAKDLASTLGALRHH